MPWFGAPVIIMTMMHLYKTTSIWRSRASAILGAVILAVALFSGFPGWLENFVYVVASLAIVVLGIAGSRPETPVAHQALADIQVNS